MRTHHLREGQIVRVVDGPFTGFCGEVKEVDEKSSIVKVAVQVYGRVMSMDVAPEQIERVARGRRGTAESDP
jgi:transcriptional antiterminator NusG